MNIAKQFKRMVLEQECALDPALEYRVLNDQLTEQDMVFLARSWKSMHSPETQEIARRLLGQSEGG
jgi:hypothetical protein